MAVPQREPFLNRLWLHLQPACATFPSTVGDCSQHLLVSYPQPTLAQGPCGEVAVGQLPPPC